MSVNSSKRRKIPVNATGVDFTHKCRHFANPEPIANNFSVMKPVLPQICSRYEVRNPVFHLPDIRHSFAEQSIHYCLIKQLNAENGSTIITGMVH